jgi:2-polyprenyl-3-methyl-5-hydroxy-6-metoxy-1,4-benzoquinol methylase
MQHSSRIWLLASMAVPLGATTAIPLDALQLGGRPAEEWALTLESGQRLSRLDIEEVVAAFELQVGDVVADIGAGTGIFSVPMAQATGASGVVLSQEVDHGFLPIIQGKAHDAGVENIYPVLGEFADPKLPRRDVDFALIHDVLHHVEQRDAFIYALGQYMGAGSRIVVVDYDMNLDNVSHAEEPEMLISPEQVAGWMAAAGFEQTREWDMFENKFVIEYSKVD